MIRTAFVTFALGTLLVSSGSCSREAEPAGNAGPLRNGLAADAAESAVDDSAPAIGFLMHRGTRYRLRDISDPVHRAQSDDDWLRAFPFNSALAIGEDAPGMAFQADSDNIISVTNLNVAGHCSGD